MVILVRKFSGVSQGTIFGPIFFKMYVNKTSLAPETDSLLFSHSNILIIIVKMTWLTQLETDGLLGTVLN